MKSSEKDINRLVLAAVLIIASAAVLITGGLIADKKSVDMPAVEIIEAEDMTVTTAESLAVTADNADTSINVTVTEEAVTASETSSGAAAAEQADGLININTAGAEELMKLKGVGEKTAAKIIEYREITPFEKPEDIMNVKGIGEKKFEDIKDNICV